MPIDYHLPFTVDAGDRTCGPNRSEGFFNSVWRACRVPLTSFFFSLFCQVRVTTTEVPRSRRTGGLHSLQPVLSFFLRSLGDCLCGLLSEHAFLISAARARASLRLCANAETSLECTLGVNASGFNNAFVKQNIKTPEHWIVKIACLKQECLVAYNSTPPPLITYENTSPEKTERLECLWSLERWGAEEVLRN